MPTASTTPGTQLLTPDDHALLMIDFQSQMAFATKSIDVNVFWQCCRTNCEIR